MYIRIYICMHICMYIYIYIYIYIHIKQYPWNPLGLLALAALRPADSKPALAPKTALLVIDTQD